MVVKNKRIMRHNMFTYKEKLTNLSHRSAPRLDMHCICTSKLICNFALNNKIHKT